MGTGKLYKDTREALANQIRVLVGKRDELDAEICDLEDELAKLEAKHGD